MNKKFLFGLLASVAMVGCSDNNGLDDKENGLDGQKGTDAYLTVNIMDASSLTRATGGDPDSLRTGTSNEHLVTSADFYFYDEKGIYVSKANVWHDGRPNGPEDTPTDETYNVEFFGNSVVVLKGLKNKTFPTYMVTILNAPTGFEPGATLDEMEKTLSYASASNTSYQNGDKFIMSTTSYKQDLPYYFVTKVNAEDFNLEPVEDEFHAIEVYVERLAAKVILKVDDSEDSKLKPVKDMENVYEIEWTVAGKDNKDESVSNETGIGAETLYVTFLNWNLNATAKYSYMMKNIDTKWTNGYLGFAWNISDLYRSYWGKSFNYGKSGYPASANDLTTTDAEGNVVAAPNEYLNYVSFKELGDDDEWREVAYCAENTNEVEVLKDAFGSAVTSILLKAKISTDPKGDNTPDLVSYQGMLFKEADYLAYVLSRVQNVDGANVWYKVSSGPDVYRQWDVDFVELQNIGDAKTKVQLKKTLPAGKDDLYRRYIVSNEAGKVDTTWISFDDDAIAGINDTLGNFNTNTGFDAIAYKGGLMYYNIPIEHLNNTNDYRDKKEHDLNSLREANYGVVRNHLYEVTINNLKNPGHGVFDPEEVIVPDAKDQNDSLYYVGAKINILSWKIVKQNVAL